MHTAPRDISSKDRSTAFLILGFLLACYLLTFTGRIDSSDGLSMAATTESLVRQGAFDSNQLLWMGNQQGNLGAGGDLFTRKGLGMVLLGVPLMWLASLWSAIGIVHAALLLNPIMTAWTGAILFRAGRRLGWSRATAMATALLFGLGTMAWPYTQGYFSDPICGWGLFAAAYGMLAYAQSGRKLYLFGAGIAWGIAYLTRTINLMTLPIYLVGLFFALDSMTRHKTQNRWGARLQAAFWRNWRPVVSFSIPVVFAGLLSLWWNWVRFGSPLDTGYVATESFSGDWLAGIFGLTIGPARGFLWYNPILLLAIPGSLWFLRHQRRIFWLSLAITTLYVVVYAKWYMWHGGYSWGPRFLVPVLPFLSLLAGPGWGALMTQRTLGWAGRVGGVLLAALSVGVQWLGMAAPFTLVQDWLAASVTPIFAPATFTQAAYSPLVAQWQFLTPANIQFAWWRGAAWPGTIDWLGLGMAMAGVLAGLLLLVQQVRMAPPLPPNTGGGDGTLRPNAGGGDGLAEGDRHDRVRNWLYAGALCVIALALLTYYQVTLRDPEVAAVAQRIAALERPRDAILHLQPGKGQEFSNSYQGGLPVYGFFNHDPLAAEDAAWLDRLEQTYTRLWVAPDALPPDQSGWERPLRIGNYLLIDDRVSGPNNQRVALYALAPAHPLVEAGLGTVFGDPAAPAPVTEENGWFRLNGYAMTAEARPGDAVLLTLLWQSLQPVDYNYQVFVHLLDAQGNKVAQRDGQPVQWLRPTSTWQPGEEIVDRYSWLLPDTTATGRYTIAVGLYDPVTGQRLPVSAGPSNYAIELGPLEVR